MQVFCALFTSYAAYMRELDSMNDRIVNLVRKEEPESQVEQVDRMAAMLEGNFMSMWSRGGDDDDPVDEAYDKRRELEESYMDRLEGLLTPEQLEAMPGRSRRGGGERGGGRGGERGGGGGWDINQMPEEVRERMLERFDTDGDGELSESEMEEIRNRFRGGGGGGEGRGGRGGRGGNSPV